MTSETGCRCSVAGRMPGPPYDLTDKIVKLRGSFLLLIPLSRAWMLGDATAIPSTRKSTLDCEPWLCALVLRPQTRLLPADPVPAPHRLDSTPDPTSPPLSVSAINDHSDTYSQHLDTSLGFHSTVQIEFALLSSCVSSRYIARSILPTPTVDICVVGTVEKGVSTTRKVIGFWRSSTL